MTDTRYYFDQKTGLTYTIRNGTHVERVEQIIDVRERIEKVRRFRAQRQNRSSYYGA